MAINPEDVKLFESQVMADEDDGGGRATGTAVIDGQINNVFPDISRLDRTLGDVALRKVFLGIDTDNADTYLGAHAVITEAAADPNVNFVIFDAGSEDDRREDARNRVESYVVRGSRALFELLGNQYEGQRQLACVQPPDRAIPSTGDVFLLQLSDESAEQYVRVTNVDSEILTFSYQSSQNTFIDFDARRITLAISAPLTTTFYGGEPTPAGTTEESSTGQFKSEVFTTEVADAARYWGVHKTAQEITSGDISVQVDNIYSSLVPSAQTEQPLIDLPLSGDSRTVRAASAADITISVTAKWITSTKLELHLPRPPVPGSVQLTLSGAQFQDNQDGTMTRTGGSLPVTTMQVDYANGIISGTRDSGTDSGTESGSVTYQPGFVFNGKPRSTRQKVTINNRGFNWNFNATAAKPLPGTLIVSYMALGEWFELRDPGNGILEGVGTGTVNFVTGTISITAEALPDVDSEIIVAYIEAIEDEYETHEGTYSGLIPETRFQLGEGVDPGSLVVTYTSGGTARTLTDQGDGTLTGDGSGTINYGTGNVEVKPIALHDDGTDFQADYDVVSTPQQMDAGPVADYFVQGTIPGAPIKPGSVAVTTSVKRWRNKIVGKGVEEVTLSSRLRDDGSGGWSAGAGFTRGAGYVGSINYTTGAYTLVIERPYSIKFTRPVYSYE